LRTKKQHKKQVSAMAFCLLLLLHPAASLPPLLPLLAVSITVAVAVAVAIPVATISFAATFS
jgi:hypothetical protein